MPRAELGIHGLNRWPVKCREMWMAHFAQVVLGGGNARGWGRVSVMSDLASKAKSSARRSAATRTGRLRRASEDVAEASRHGDWPRTEIREIRLEWNAWSTGAGRLGGELHLVSASLAC